MDPNQRIAQFEAMVRPEADPNNDMAWFSLGSAYRDAGRHADAARAFARSYELNPAMSKAYQLAGQSLVDSGDTAGAGRVLTEGYTVAAQRGDRMPMKAMGDLLAKLGLPVPQAVAAAAAPAAHEGSFTCKRTGRPGSKLGRPPFRGPVGQWIFENISSETWNAWIAQGTKVINELRLDLSTEDGAATYDRHMREYLGIDDELYEQLVQAR